jgi:hypothetical protein
MAKSIKGKNWERAAGRFCGRKIRSGALAAKRHEKTQEV